MRQSQSLFLATFAGHAAAAALCSVCMCSCVYVGMCVPECMLTEEKGCSKRVVGWGGRTGWGKLGYAMYSRVVVASIQ